MADYKISRKYLSSFKFGFLLCLAAIINSCGDRNENNFVGSEEVNTNNKTSIVSSENHARQVIAEQNKDSALVLVNKSLQAEFDKYASVMKPIGDLQNREPVYTVSFSYKDKKPIVTFFTNYYIGESTLDSHGEIGMGRQDGRLIRIEDYDNRLFEHWYNASALTIKDLDKFRITEEENDTAMPPHWKYSIEDDKELKLIYESDTLRFM